MKDTFLFGHFYIYRFQRFKSIAMLVLKIVNTYILESILTSDVKSYVIYCYSTGQFSVFSPAGNYIPMIGSQWNQDEAAWTRIPIHNSSGYIVQSEIFHPPRDFSSWSRSPSSASKVNHRAFFAQSVTWCNSDANGPH